MQCNHQVLCAADGQMGGTVIALLKHVNVSGLKLSKPFADPVVLLATH
jgi:hypothetical protein